ncbi:hypothetical protein [Aerosakkonema sp. BLCC-F183]|uniref:hypothetical protein n=1 Tax=Aerosakkonema sp. BLCC-F183 TaxID=3342834 RepID=UPI0035BC6081
MTYKLLFVDDEPDLESLVSQKFRKKVRTAEYPGGETTIGQPLTACGVDRLLSKKNRSAILK